MNKTQLSRKKLKESDSFELMNLLNILGVNIVFLIFVVLTLFLSDFMIL